VIGFFKSLFATGNPLKTIENIALEAIQTDADKAEAKAIYFKSIDPNGSMRVHLTRFVCNIYGWFLAFGALMIILHVFFNLDGTKEALEMMQSFVMPVTSAFGLIVSASFGVNYANVKQGK